MPIIREFSENFYIAEIKLILQYIARGIDKYMKESKVRLISPNIVAKKNISIAYAI
jgi:hypothetical protein